MTNFLEVQLHKVRALSDDELTYELWYWRQKRDRGHMGTAQRRRLAAVEVVAAERGVSLTK